MMSLRPRRASAYDASVQARAMAFFAGLVAFAAAHELDYIVSAAPRRARRILHGPWRRQTALGMRPFVSGAAAVSGAGTYGALLLETATSRWSRTASGRPSRPRARRAASRATAAGCSR